jgi:excinuclease ABC subunit C
LQNIKNIKLFFEGKKKQILRNLKKEMNAYAKTREFEKASEIKRQIFALQHINDIALLKVDSFSDTKILSSAPSFRIEAYDIAHLGGKNMVGVMTVVDLPAGRQGMGEVAKNEYKRFKIRTQKDTNDTGALKEVLERRLAHTEWLYPSFVVVDGGAAQINAAEGVMRRAKLDIPVVSVVKDERHKARGIMGGKAITRKYKREILLANSEAHRFAINYHKNMRNKNFLPSK